MHGQQNIKFRL